MLLDLNHYRALRRQNDASKTPLLVFTAIDVVSMADSVRLEFFPTVLVTSEVIFVNGSFLGCIYHRPSAGSLICLHEILNSPDVPERIFRHILTHELIHLIVASREVDGKFTTHPPEFWQLEHDLSPDGGWVMEWLWRQLRSCLIIDKKNECLKVKRDWRKRITLQSRSVEEIIGPDRKGNYFDGVGI